MIRAWFWSVLIRFGCPRRVLHKLDDDWEHGVIRCIYCGRTDW